MASSLPGRCTRASTSPPPLHDPWVLSNAPLCRFHTHTLPSLPPVNAWSTCNGVLHMVHKPHVPVNRRRWLLSSAVVISPGCASATRPTRTFFPRSQLHTVPRASAVTSYKRSRVF